MTVFFVGNLGNVGFHRTDNNLSVFGIGSPQRHHRAFRTVLRVDHFGEQRLDSVVHVRSFIVFGVNQIVVQRSVHNVVPTNTLFHQRRERSKQVLQDGFLLLRMLLQNLLQRFLVAGHFKDCKVRAFEYDDVIRRARVSRKRSAAGYCIERSLMGCFFPRLILGRKVFSLAVKLLEKRRPLLGGCEINVRHRKHWCGRSVLDELSDVAKKLLNHSAALLFRAIPVLGRGVGRFQTNSVSTESQHTRGQGGDAKVSAWSFFFWGVALIFPSDSSYAKCDFINGVHTQKQNWQNVFSSFGSFSKERGRKGREKRYTARALQLELGVGHHGSNVYAPLLPARLKS